eukprot:403354338
MSAILEINSNGDLIFGGSLYNQPFLGKQVNRQYYYLVSWMKVFQTQDSTQQGTITSVDSIAYKEVNGVQLIATAIRTKNTNGVENIFIGTFYTDGTFKEGGIFQNQNVPINKVRQMVVFNDQLELIWAYQLGQNNARITKFSADQQTLQYTLSFPIDSWTYYVKSLYTSAGLGNFVYFGGQKFTSGGNDLLFGCFKSNGDSPSDIIVQGMSINCLYGNCFSLSVNMIHGYNGNGNKELFGCISNEHNVNGELHAWGFVAMNLDQTSQQSAFVQYANSPNIEYYCSGIHIRSNESLAVFITKVDKVAQTRGFVPYVVRNFVFKEPTFSQNYLHINQVTYFRNSLERIYLAGYYRDKSLKYNKAFMYQHGDETQIQDSIGDFDAGNYEIFISLIWNFYPITLSQVQSQVSWTSLFPAYSVSYDLDDTRVDGRFDSVTIPGFTPILSYTEETLLFNFTHSNRIYDCFIGYECIVEVVSINIQNCSDGIDSQIRIQVGNLTIDMESSDLIQYKTDKMYQLPFTLSFRFTPTVLSFKSLDYKDFKLTIYSYFDYPLNQVLGISQNQEFYLRIWDECYYHRKEIYQDPRLPQVNLAPYFETSLKNKTINVGASTFYKLPKTFDQNGNNIEIEYHIGVVQIFTDTVDNKGDGMMTFNPKKEHVGEYAVEIWLKDDHPTQPLTTKYKLGIIVVGGNGSFGFENITEEESSASQTQFIENIRAKIKRIDYKGEMLILFDTNIKIPRNYTERLNKSLEINLEQNGIKQKQNYSIQNIKAMRALLEAMGDESSASVEAFVGGNFILSIFMQAIVKKCYSFLGVKVYSIYGE